MIGALLAQPQHLAGILDAIERKDIPASAISSVRRAAFAKSKDAAIRDRAAKLFTAAAGDRQKVFDEAKACLALTPKPEHGHQLFTQLCTTCHRLNQEGSAVGPDLFDMRNQPKESILFHIIIPDAEIAPVFTAYLAETKDGRTLAGLLASETSHQRHPPHAARAGGNDPAQQSRQAHRAAQLAHADGDRRGDVEAGSGGFAGVLKGEKE